MLRSHPALAGLCALLALAGCGEPDPVRVFERAFERVRPGMSRAEVVALLGEPHLNVEATLSIHYIGGPEILSDTLAMGEPFEWWRWQLLGEEGAGTGERRWEIFHVYFGTTSGAPPERWEVLRTDHEDENDGVQ